MRLLNYLKKLFRPEQKDSVKKDPYDPREKNTIYPNDELGRAHLEEWLDDVFWKHHG